VDRTSSLLIPLSVGDDISPVWVLIHSPWGLEPPSNTVSFTFFAKWYIDSSSRVCRVQTVSNTPPPNHPFPLALGPYQTQNSLSPYQCLYVPHGISIWLAVFAGRSWVTKCIHPIIPSRGIGDPIWYDILWAKVSMCSKRHLNPFSRFCTIHGIHHADKGFAVYS